MYQPYTERFLVVAAPAVWTHYTVPAGKRAIVMSVVLTNSSSTASLITVAAGTAVLVYAPLPAGATTAYTGLRFATYQGEQISGHTELGGCYISVSGYLFNDPVASSGAPPVQEGGLPPALTVDGDQALVDGALRRASAASDPENPDE